MPDYFDRANSAYFWLTKDPLDCYILGSRFQISQFFDTLDRSCWANGTQFKYRGREYRVSGSQLLNILTGKPLRRRYKRATPIEESE